MGVISTRWLAFGTSTLESTRHAKWFALSNLQVRASDGDASRPRTQQMCREVRRRRHHPARLQAGGYPVGEVILYLHRD